MQKEYTGAIYIIGPDQKKYYEQGSSFLKDRINNILIIGDGKSDILNANNEGQLKKLETIRQDNPQLLTEGKILVYIETHGIAWDNIHYIQTAKDHVIASKDLFELLSKSIKTPVDIIFTPCNGKAVLTDVEILPKDSRIIIFSDSNQTTNAQNLASTLSILPKGHFALNDFYDNYLSNVFSMNESPVMHIVGKGTIDPIILSKSYLGKNISDSSRQYVHNHFRQSICKNNLLCHNKLDNIMNKIEEATSIDNFKVIASENYFSALNEFFTQMNTEYKFTRNNNHYKDVIYNYKEPEYCYIEILELKVQVDELLLKHKIPLNLDLSHQSWYDIDVDYPTDDELELIRESSDACLFYIFKYEGFIENYNFPTPEHSEYGLVLGIIKDIHLSLFPKDSNFL